MKPNDLMGDYKAKIDAIYANYQRKIAQKPVAAAEPDTVGRPLWQRWLLFFFYFAIWAFCYGTYKWLRHQ